MPERTVTIASSVGLHARPASLFSQAAGGLACFLVPTPANGAYLLSWDLFQEGALRVPVN